MNINDMVQNNPEVLIQNVGGVLVADSLGVAERFGKRNHDVVQAIETLISQMKQVEDKRIFPFISDTYMDNMNRSRKKYLLTRDGFSLLVMGFTGTAALHWKLLYIDAFNKMEAALQQKLNPQPQVDVEALVTRITTQVLNQVIPVLAKAVEPQPAEPPKPRKIYAVVETRPKRTYVHYNGYDPQAAKNIAWSLEHSKTPYVILEGTIEPEDLPV